MLTGYKCPGCGTQRALYAFLHGRIMAGILENPILLPSVGYAGLLMFVKSKPIYTILSGKIACRTIAVIFCAYWLLRNIFNF